MRPVGSCLPLMINDVFIIIKFCLCSAHLLICYYLMYLEILKYNSKIYLKYIQNNVLRLRTYLNLRGGGMYI